MSVDNPSEQKPENPTPTSGPRILHVIPALFSRDGGVVGGAGD